MHILSIVNVVLALALAPLLLGVINRTKAFFAGRQGAPLMQAYYDLVKLINKGAVYSRTTSWIFRAAPVVGFAAVVCAMLFVPVGKIPALLSFEGDLIFFAYLLGLMRFVTVTAALDTGSSFEGMGASREVFFSTLAEPALLIGLAALARQAGSISISGIFAELSGHAWMSVGPALMLVAASMLIVFLAENARIPVDDPNTHLELTMIHEVMVLDYSGPDFAFILYSVSLKLWVLGALLMNLLITIIDLNNVFVVAVFVLGMLILAMIVGIIESVMARLSLLKVPQLLVGAGAVSVLAFVHVLRFAQ